MTKGVSPCSDCSDCFPLGGAFPDVTSGATLEISSGWLDSGRMEEVTRLPDGGRGAALEACSDRWSCVGKEKVTRLPDGGSGTALGSLQWQVGGSGVVEKVPTCCPGNREPGGSGGPY